jgi:hypothetical protein
MAIAGVPQGLVVQTGNQNNYLSWSLAAGATSYSIQRSTDGVNYTVLATPSANNYLDQAVTIGVQYFYQVASVNGSGTSGYCTPLSIIPAPTGEMSLGSLRLAAQQKADRINSQFVTTQEWNTFINLAMNELYDLLITVYEDYFMAPRVQFTAPGNQSIFPLPNGTLQFNSYPNQGPLFTAAPFYKLLGVDLGLQNANNAFVTVNKYSLIDRNRFVYPNTASSLYGVFNLQYRVLGSNIEFIPQPSGGQVLQLLYIPRLPLLLADTDITTIGFSGWLEYVIVRAAKYALDKEESDTTKLTEEILFIKGRIEETAVNRDAGQPDKISDLRQGRDFGNGSGWGWNGSIGGF